VGATGAPSVAVNATRVELTGGRRVASRLGVELSLVAAAGRLHLGYRPDHVTIEPTGPGSAIDVALAPIDAWVYGAGLALRRPLGGRWSTGLEVDRQGYGWDAAHRDGGTTEIRHEWFGDWSAHLELAWHPGRR
jgi:hypothetical protein